jgi:phosphoribosyl 1,2-cyclic phosphate phosphodiesterase
MTGSLEITLLGSGSSGGVPRADGDWGACDPAEPRNRRTRCSLLVQYRGQGVASSAEPTTILIDTSPDLRQQLIDARVRRLDAIVYSHDHADQTHGIDDVRALVYAARKRIPAYMDEPTRTSLVGRFGYVFEGVRGYPPLLEIAGEIAPLEPFVIDGPGGAVSILPLDQDHGGVRSLGFRIGTFAYNNDVVALPEPTLEALGGLELWIADALRYTPHPSHAHLERTLEWAARLKPRRTILTNLHIDLDYQRLRAQLPHGVEAGYDGLTVGLKLS